MKSLGILIIISGLLALFSCEVNDTSKIRINAANIPAEVVRLHLTVFSGDDVVAQKSVDVSDLADDNMIELYVSPGENRQVVLLAECFDGEQYTVDYMGSETTDLSAGKEVKVGLKMAFWEYTYWNPYTGGAKAKYWVTYYDDQGYYTFQWNSIGIPHVKYRVEQYNNYSYTYELFYEGYDLSAEGNSLPNGTTSFKFYPVFELFGLNGRKVSF